MGGVLGPTLQPMCGIIGATGPEGVLPLLLDGLARLEYRGYDSAGVVVVDRDSGSPRVWCEKRAVGTKSVAELALSAGGGPGRGSCGLGHTRWATHGRPSEVNAHPHLDCGRTLALVHNGIVENYLELGDALVSEGHDLVSETDSEVLVHLLEDACSGGSSLSEAVRSLLAKVRGTFALAIVDLRQPDVLVATRRASPLVIGTSGSLGLVASDIPAVLGKTDRVYVLEDDQVAEVGPGWLKVSDAQGVTVQPREMRVTWDLEAAERGGYPDFMAKEIHEQPRAISETLIGKTSKGGLLRLDEERISDDELRQVEKIFTVACGSSYHASLVAKHAIEHWARLPVEIDVASEFRYRDPIFDSHSLVVGVSQSGETMDTLQALRSARRQGAKTLVVSNVVDSSMARESDAVLYTRAGPEVGVAATKTHLTQLVALELLALYLAQVRGIFYPGELEPLLDAMESLPSLVSRALGKEQAVADVASRLVSSGHFFFLGRNVGHAVAMEGALKLKEISYLHAEGYPAGELKHGPIALIEPGSVVVGVTTRGRLWEKMLSNVAEVRARGATIVLVAEEGDEETAAQADLVLEVPRSPHELLSPVLDVVPLQLLAYHLAKAKGTDVDRPRNLAKTVTVE